MKETWRVIRGVLHAVGRNVVVRILVGLLAALGAADQASDEPVVAVLGQDEAAADKP